MYIKQLNLSNKSSVGFESRFINNKAIINKKKINMRAVFVVLAVLVFAFVFMNDAVAQGTGEGTGATGATGEGTGGKTNGTGSMGANRPYPICGSPGTGPIATPFKPENETDPEIPSEDSSSDDQSEESSPPNQE